MSSRMQLDRRQSLVSHIPQIVAKDTDLIGWYMIEPDEKWMKTVKRQPSKKKIFRSLSCKK